MLTNLFTIKKKKIKIHFAGSTKHKQKLVKFINLFKLSFFCLRLLTFDNCIFGPTFMIFVMNEIEGVPFKEIAEKTGQSVNTLLSRKRYAVLHLRDRLSVLKDELLNY